MKGCLIVLVIAGSLSVAILFALSVVNAVAPLPFDTMFAELNHALLQAAQYIEQQDWSFVGAALARAVKAAFWPVVAIGLLIGISYRLRRGR